MGYRWGTADSPRGTRIRFTTKSLTALRSKAAAHWVTDDALPGFRMKVLPSGDKSFAVRNWSSLDLDGQRARLADTKTGLSWRPLGSVAVELLRRMDRIEGSQYVFPSRSADKPLRDIKHVWYAVRHAAGLDTARLHDLRHHFASTGALRGLSEMAVGRLLGHKDLATTRKYSHLGEDPTMRAANEIAASIAASTRTSEVIPGSFVLLVYAP